MIIIKIYIAADHLGVDLKNEIIEYLKSHDIDVNEIGLENHPTDDYTDFAFSLGKLVTTSDSLGILICGNGIGMSIAANKVNGIRCARVLTVDDAFKCRNHNGANVISLSANNDVKMNKDIVDTFLFTKYPSEERYLRRIDKIKRYEEEN